MSESFDYFDLVVKTVRGHSPIPEYQNYSEDRTQLAKDHIKFLKQKFKGHSSGNILLDIIIKTGPSLLCKLWDKMSPAALTMCGDKSINQLIDALKNIQKENIPGDFIETGVWRGGMPIIMRAFLKSINDKNRTVWVADSFKGLPKDIQDPKDKTAQYILEPLHRLAVSQKQVEKSFDFFGLKDEQVQFLSGWFKDTLKKMPDQPLALVRLDGDYYESTMDALIALYPKLSAGGYLIVDDYNLPLGCKRAVNEYRQKNNVAESIVKINKQAIYWRKGKS